MKMKFTPSTIPDILKDKQNWILWAKRPRDGGGTDKIPINARTLGKAQSNNSSTWTDFDTACRSLKANADGQAGGGVISGLGFMLYGSGIVCIDLDHIGDDLQAYRDGRQQGIVWEFMHHTEGRAYAEISQSGEGVHIFAAGRLPEGARKRNGVEMYDDTKGRFIAMTGDIIDNTHTIILDNCTDLLKELHSKYLAPREQPLPRAAHAAPPPVDDVDIQKALNTARKINKDGRFIALYDRGDISEYGDDESRADLALCNDLCYFLHGDAAKIDTAFRASALMRDKWDRRTGGTTYGQMTIDKATKGTTEYFEYEKQPYSITISRQTGDQTETRATTAPEPVGEPPEPPTDYTDFFLQANKQLTVTDYHRGISLDTLNRFNVGFVETWRHPKAPPTVPTSPRLIIPTSGESYLARDTRPADQIPEQGRNYIKSKVGKTHLFNPKALEADEGAIFVVEDEINAMSIEDIDGHAVGLGSMNNGNLLLQAVKEHKPTQTLVIALDSESDPVKADKVRTQAAKIAADLKQVGVKAVVISDLWGRYKDPNEMLQGDRSQLQSIIYQVSKDPENWEKTQYLNTFADHRTADYFAWIFNQADKPYTPTGFKELDRILNGGLYNEKLYAVGAISSLGKTTLVMQIADNIARSGRDVLIFSLEMSEFELYGKSISRLTYEITQREGGDSRNAKTELGISLNERWIAYSDAEKALIMQASQEHAEIGRHKKVLSGIGGYTVDRVKEAVQRHISFTGKAPVAVVDYVQILESTDPRLSDKQKVDHDITTLKRLAVEYKTPVIVISSLNRQNYKLPISYEAFKESGAIEYSVDVLIGLQLHGVGDPDFNVDKAKQADPREIELVLLKQRQGKTGLKIGFDYYPMFNYFTETGVIENDNYKDDQTEDSGSGITTRYSDRPKVDKQAFKAQWNLIAAQQLEGGFADEWRLERELHLLNELDRTSDLYLTYYKKYSKGLKKAERAKAEQMKLQPYNPPEYDSKSGKEIYHGKGTAEKSGVEYVKDMDYIIDES